MSGFDSFTFSRVGDPPPIVEGVNMIDTRRTHGRKLYFINPDLVRRAMSRLSWRVMVRAYGIRRAAMWMDFCGRPWQHTKRRLGRTHV